MIDVLHSIILYAGYFRGLSGSVLLRAAPVWFSPGKGFRAVIFCREPCHETINKNMVILSGYEVEYKKDENFFNKQ